MVDGHQTVNLALRYSVGSNPSTPTKLTLQLSSIDSKYIGEPAIYLGTLENP